MKNLITFIMLLMWIAGIVIAKGFISTCAALFFPLWAFYLVMERALTHFL